MNVAVHNFRLMTPRSWKTIRKRPYKIQLRHITMLQTMAVNWDPYTGSWKIERIRISNRWSLLLRMSPYTMQLCWFHFWWSSYMKVHVLITYVASVLRHSAKWNLRNGKLFEIKWTVTSCIYYSSRFSISLYFLKNVNIFVLHISIARSVQRINCRILS